MTPPRIRRVQVTHIHGYDHSGRSRITHPWLWEWTDPEGTTRYFDTKAAALAAHSAQEDDR